MDLVSSRGVAAPFLFAFALLGACGGGGSDDPADTSGASESSSGGGSGSESESSESGTLAGSCVGHATAGSKGHVFIAAGAAGGNACEAKPAPCGGDPTGEWTLDASCVYDMSPLPNPFYQSCPGASYAAQPPVRTGTLSVGADGSFELSMATTHDFTFGADITCLGLFDCGPQAEQALTSEGGGTASCTGGPLSCNCTVTGYQTDVVHMTGDGALDGRDVLFVDTVPQPLPYCVTDDRLDVWTLIQAPRPKDVACAEDSDCAPEDDEILVCES